VVAGLIASAFGLSTTVLAGGALTLASGLLAARWISETRHAPAGWRQDARAREGSPRP
jgi:hypothetical protein